MFQGRRFSLAMSLIASAIVSPSSFVSADWRYIVVADWHGGEGFARDSSTTTDNYQEKLAQFTWLKQNHGGELMMLPGDTQSGKWWDKNFVANFYSGKTVNQAVFGAGSKCYPTMRKMFKEAGYGTLVVSTGDHEYGGNGWGPMDDKTKTLGEFRYTFGNGFNFDGKWFKWPGKINGQKSFPAGTEFETTSYAYKHNNALFITVDAFYQVGLNMFFDRQNGLGGEGVVTCTVTGKHLTWFENMLKLAKKDSSIKHIFVQAHLPIAQPVRKVNCSGQFFDEGTDSPFWKLMEAYGVDIYFAGEVHANTVTKSKKSSLIQVVSRGNRLNNFITVDVGTDSITLNQYNEKLGESTIADPKYEKFGSLTIDKSTKTNIKINGNGSLKPLNIAAPILHYDFEALHGIDDRQVLGLKENDNEFVEIEVEIRGKVVTEAIWNKGSFSQQYDAQVGGITLVKGVKGLAGSFDGSSRMGISGVGPHGPGTAMSLSFWMKTSKKDGNFILWLYGQSFGSDDAESNKDAQLLTLEKGELNIHRRSNSHYVPVNNMNLANGKWNHVVVNMPKDNCALSQVEVYINGQKTAYKVTGMDDYIFHNTSGRCSIGGFGYASGAFEKLYSNVKPYIGLIDEFKLYGRPMNKNDIKRDLKAGNNRRRRERYLERKNKKSEGKMTVE